MALASFEDYFGDKKPVMLMSDAAAQAYKAADGKIGIMKILVDWPYYSMSKPDDHSIAPLVGGCGSTGEDALYKLVS